MTEEKEKGRASFLLSALPSLPSHLSGPLLPLSSQSSHSDLLGALFRLPLAPRRRTPISQRLCFFHRRTPTISSSLQKRLATVSSSLPKRLQYLPSSLQDPSHRRRDSPSCRPLPSFPNPFRPPISPFQAATPLGFRRVSSSLLRTRRGRLSIYSSRPDLLLPFPRYGISEDIYPLRFISHELVRWTLDLPRRSQTTCSSRPTPFPPSPRLSSIGDQRNPPQFLAHLLYSHSRQFRSFFRSPLPFGLLRRCSSRHQQARAWSLKGVLPFRLPHLRSGRRRENGNDPPRSSRHASAFSRDE
jgi:hypothetical protein